MATTETSDSTPGPGSGPGPERIAPGSSLAEVRQLAAGCRACDLWKCATRTVFGEGPESARVMLVGEVPGDREDLAGRPFVGPGGRVLDGALEAAGVDRRDLYLTNAVKHFKWVAKGKRRLHQKPSGREIAACRPWLLAEIARVAPEVVVCLGAVAAQSLLGRDFRVTERRGEVYTSEQGTRVMATVHPASVLRVRDERERAVARERFVADLAQIPALLGRRRRR